MADWPFSNPKPGGYSQGDIIDDAEVVLLAQQANIVGNGALWNELTLLANWRSNFEIHTTPFATYGKPQDAVYDVSGHKWYIICDDAVSPANALGAVVPVTSTAGSDLTALTITNDTTYQPKVIASDGAGTIVMGGGNDSSSAEKFRYATSSGTSFSVSSIPSASTAIVTGIVWDSVNSKFIACFDDGNICTDADGTGTWTQISQQYVLVARTSLAVNDSGRCVVLASDRVLVSDDAANWTEYTLPETVDGKIIWVGSTIQRFFILGSTSALQSKDGIEWLGTSSASVISAIGFTPVGLSVNNRCIACLQESTMAVVASIDGARTWRTMYRLTDKAPNIQAMFKQGPYGSIAIGTETAVSNPDDDELFLSMHCGM